MEPIIHLPNGNYLTFTQEHDCWKITLNSESSVKFRKNDNVYFALKLGFTKETFKEFPELLDDLIINKELVRITGLEDTVYFGKACTLITARDLNKNFKQTFSNIVDDINRYFDELRDVLDRSNKKFIIHISKCNFCYFNLHAYIEDQTFTSRLTSETLMHFLKVLVDHQKVSRFETSRDDVFNKDLIEVSVGKRPIIQIRSAMKSVLPHLFTHYVDPNVTQLPYKFTVTESHVQVLSKYFIEHSIPIDNYEDLRLLPLLYNVKLNELKYIKRLSDLAMLFV